MYAHLLCYIAEMNSGPISLNDFKIEGASGCIRTGKVNVVNLVETNIHRWFVDIHETFLEWIKVARSLLSECTPEDEAGHGCTETEKD